MRVGGRSCAPELWAQLEGACRQTPSAAVLEDDLSIDSLYAACDVYASLHRAEGFGLTLAEAMLRGRATLASGWSGNLEFISPEACVLIPCTLTAIHDPQGLYPEGDVWAEPDLAAAAGALRMLATRPEFRAELAERGRRWAAARLVGPSRLPGRSPGETG